MIMRNVTDIEEIRDELKEAASDNHRYAENYQFDKMKKRWDKYLQFYLLKDEEKSVAMGGIVKFGDNLVRICDRYCTFRSYRRFGINKFIKKNIRFCVEYFVTQQTEWAIQNGYQPFISMSAEIDKTNSMKRFLEYFDPKWNYRLLPDLYLTCNRDNPKCRQHIITNNSTIELEKV
tara:strand:- start:581 stop:1108 length:528 start_codon:yes stop_codon:yes gene_type:complete